MRTWLGGLLSDKRGRTPQRTGEALPESTLPLAGVTVLDLTRLPPGAFSTVLLADLGATVIRVELPKRRRLDGPIGLNRVKYSVAVDLRHPRGHEVLRRLVAHADILVENERPGAMDERGFGYSHAVAEFPRLIWCSVSGYGQDGPYAQWSGHDLAFAAHSGPPSAFKPEGPWNPQLILAIPIGALMANVGILAALSERDQTGAGCQLDISLSESASWLLSSSEAILSRPPAGIPAGPDASVARANRGLDLPDDPPVKARSLLQQVGDALVPRSPIRFRDRAGGERPAPETFPPTPVGARTRYVLEKTGLDPAAIDELLAAGVIGAPGA
jgi:crotonobetainyl-CoA:carnitine CoA-transferase CaiB-like acyl-CoA transferase